MSIEAALIHEPVTNLRSLSAAERRAVAVLESLFGPHLTDARQGIRTSLTTEYGQSGWRQMEIHMPAIVPGLTPREWYSALVIQMEVWTMRNSIVAALCLAFPARAEEIRAAFGMEA